MSEEKKLKKKFMSQIVFFSRARLFFFLIGHYFADFAHFLTKILPIWGKNSLFGMSEEKNNNIQMSGFFSRQAHFEIVGGIMDQRI